MADQRGPLDGLRVIDLSNHLAGAFCSQFLADAGADVVSVEPAGGNPVRRFPGWPGLFRGRRSVALDISVEADRETLQGLLATADVLVHGLRPSEAAEYGLSAEQLGAGHPRLVTAHITGFGAHNGWSHYKHHEALVYAKAGVMHNKRQLTRRPGPAYVSVPYASWAAAHNAVHGTLAALLERETSGRGQVVETSLVQGIGAMDTYNWFYEMILDRYPGAYSPMDLAYDTDFRPSAPLLYALLIAPTKDGVWLQFAQTAPRLMQAWLKELGLLEVLADPKWAGFPLLPTAELREEFWLEMITRVRQRTLAEWQQAFEHNPDVSAEIFRTPIGAYDHPQVQFEGRALTIDQPGIGPVKQPAPVVFAEGKPIHVPGPAPAVGADSETLRAEATVALAARSSQTVSEGPRTLPLAGLTIVELGTMFAGPYGVTMLTDLGARVIKIESLEGDNIRTLVPFPEAGGAKVLQGKESLAIDANSPEGREIVRAIVAEADIVFQCMRAGAAERMGLDEATVKALNPDLIYVNSFGYGHDGPYALRPAYAPSIGSSSGIAYVDSRGRTVPPQNEEEVRSVPVVLHSAHAVPVVQADGIAAAAVASTIMLAVYAKKHSRTTFTGLTTTMVGSALNCLNHLNNEYEGAVEAPVVDEEFWGLNALYRMYPARDGYVFLAAAEAGEWDELVAALKPFVSLASDPRFADEKLRAEHDGDLADVLAGVFATKEPRVWEEELTPQDVGCVAVAEANAERVMQGDEFAEAGFTADAVSPIFDEHRRLAPMVSFSRSLTKADAGCTIGQHTDALLTEFGFGDRIADLRARKIVG
ncbi:CaiB/BaiF CoA transferase family protein [Streptomyces sp. NPDC021080]|uniref:CaiB/BaiF CoA transferase family protein n=1 Tax=Streptomyces sp. NPDC021080 TaxID=3365110 RepID=UPI0037BC7709